VRELGSRERAQPAPHILWDTLASPAQEGPRVWLRLGANEVLPSVLEGHRPEVIVWSSLWSRRPKDLIRFDIRSDGGGGSLLRWTVLTPDEMPSDEDLGRLRYRMNRLVNAELRYSFGQ
jgi:hypothetical protein